MSTEKYFTIGRSRQSDIVLADDSVSRIHAKLSISANGNMVIIDNKSTHGTFLSNSDCNATLITQNPVDITDTILFGECALKVLDLIESIRLKHPDFNLNYPESYAEPTPNNTNELNTQQTVTDNCTTSVQTIEKSFLSKLVAGDYGLAKTYWQFGVLVNIILGIIEKLITPDIPSLILTFLSSTYSVFVMLGVWRASKKYEGAKFWSILAKFMCIVAFFLQVVIFIAIGELIKEIM